jgi:hypothetical protein
MKAEPILQEIEAVKERLAAQAGGDTQRFLEQMDTWLAEHPHAGPVVNSLEELQARIQAREAAEPAPCQASRTRFMIPSSLRSIAFASNSRANGNRHPLA